MIQARSGIRLRHLRLFGTVGNDRTYDVSFLKGDDEWRPFSIVAGASASGKTSVVEYVMYCLGAQEFPDHEEMKQNVRSAALEVEVDGVTHTIERTTVGASSKFASIWPAALDDLPTAKETRKPIEPPSDPDSLSQFVLSTFGLGGIKLPVSPSKADSDTAALSIRDLFRVIFYANSRLDSENLVFENGNQFVGLKFQQSIDLIFGVADDSIADLAQRIQAAERVEKEAEKASIVLRHIVEDEYPQGPAGVQILADNARNSAAQLSSDIDHLDQGLMQHQAVTYTLRNSLLEAQAELDKWDIRIKNRASLVDRLSSLALQYGDDKRKLVFLKEAERLFDPLHVTHCPACLANLAQAPAIEHGACNLCGHAISGDPATGDMPTQTAEKSILVERELAATSRRLDQLTEYLGRLRTEYNSFLDARSVAADRAAGASYEIDRLATLPAPYLAQRDHLTKNRSAATSEAERSALGVRLWERVNEADKEHALRKGQTSILRREKKEASVREDRSTVVKRLSDRFAAILADFHYPKLSDAWLDNKLIPHVRGSIYTKASSGGLTLISIAWALTILEVSYEDDANAPGFLVIDSPQKNLGATQTDPDFRDAQLVDHVYNHVTTWLSGNGHGAQIIFIDNTPPALAAEDVVVRFTGNPDLHPYGLIHNATS